jgi:hypothetical protein
MAEVTQYMFDLKEVTEALVKKQGIHEGIWGIAIEFGLGALNMNIGPDQKTTVPTAIAGVQKIGIRRYDEDSNVTVNAADVNPAGDATKKNQVKKTKK